jgi:uncharacterized repeat protein (TIGR03843 family)
MPRDEWTFVTRLTPPAVPEAIAAGELEILGLLPNGSNYTFLARATAADGDRRLTVYKPRRGEVPLWDFAEGTLCQREVAAYLVAMTLGWPNVPPTILRDGPEGPGSVQAFVRFEPHEHYFTLQDRFPDAFREVALFDLLVNNADRKGGHCLLGEDGRIWVIDHGVCFSEEPKLRTVIWEYMEEPIPHHLVADVQRFRRSLASGDVPHELSMLLSEPEMLAMGRRADEILAEPVYPTPVGERPFPWPPV